MSLSLAKHISSRFIQCGPHSAQDLGAAGSVAVPTPVLSVRSRGREGDVYFYAALVGGDWVGFEVRYDIGIHGVELASRTCVVKTIVTPGWCMEDDPVFSWTVLAVQQTPDNPGLVDTIPENPKQSRLLGCPV